MVDFLILPAEMMGCVRVAKPRSTQSANKQLATVQKRICVIEFLRLRLIIVYQDSEINLKNPPDGGFFDFTGGDDGMCASGKAHAAHNTKMHN